jgi:hypothetical protein
MHMRLFVLYSYNDDIADKTSMRCVALLHTCPPSALRIGQLSKERIHMQVIVCFEPRVQGPNAPLRQGGGRLAP